MFDIGWSELLLIGTLSVIFIGPKQMPMVAYKLGVWLGSLKRLTGQFRQQVEQAAYTFEVQEHNKKILQQEKEEVNKEINPDAAPHKQE